MMISVPLQAKRHFFIPTLALLCMACQTAIAAEVDTPLQLRTSGYLEAGLTHSNLSAGYGAWKGQFVRGTLHSDENNTWNAEVTHLDEFGDSGMLFVLGDSFIINPEWFASINASSSSGGFFLPRLRLDASINRKWLERLNLVTTLSVTAVNAKDGHSDRGIMLAAAYYFETPWIIEGGIRSNRSNPGDVMSYTKYFAVTHGEEKHRYISLSYSFGGEAYQVIGENALISDFSSNIWTLTWRQWLDQKYGFQMRAVSYTNPYYNRVGGEFSLFRDF